eukprot:Amastigsp_a340717_227.p1 type:complete len:315 gc:universal Amastigsp_a340717_227:999-55(-)
MSSKRPGSKVSGAPANKKLKDNDGSAVPVLSTVPPDLDIGTAFRVFSTLGYARSQVENPSFFSSLYRLVDEADARPGENLYTIIVMPRIKLALNLITMSGSNRQEEREAAARQLARIGATREQAQDLNAFVVPALQEAAAGVDATADVAVLEQRAVQLSAAAVELGLKHARSGCRVGAESQPDDMLSGVRDGKLYFSFCVFNLGLPPPYTVSPWLSSAMSDLNNTFAFVPGAEMCVTFSEDRFWFNCLGCRLRLVASEQRVSLCGLMEEPNWTNVYQHLCRHLTSGNRIGLNDDSLRAFDKWATELVELELASP